MKRACLKRACLRGRMLPFLVPMSLTSTSGALLADTEGWVADASKSVFPLHRAAGKLYGKAFRVDLAKISLWSGKVGGPPSKQPENGGAMLTLQEGKEFIPTNYYRISLVTRPGQTVEGKTFIVPAGGLLEQTEEIMNKDKKSWAFPVGGVQAASTQKHDVLAQNSLRLTFGKRQGKVLPGKVYLCLKDSDKSYVAGAFEAAVDSPN